MKNIIFKTKSEKRNSIKSKRLDLNINPNNKKYKNIFNNFFSSNKKSENNTIHKDDNSIELSSAYKNINLMLSNCLESIRAEDIEPDKHKSPFFKDLKGLLKKSDNRLEIIKNKNSFGAGINLNKSYSLSNSNILMKTSEENILNNLNIEPLSKNTTNKVQNFNLKKTLSVNSNYNSNSNLKSKVSSLLNKNSLFSPKRTNTKKKQYLKVNKKKKENDFNINKDKLLSKFDKSVNRTKSSMNLIKKSVEFNNIIISSSSGNGNSISPKSLKNVNRITKKNLSKKNLSIFNKINKSESKSNSNNDMQSKNEKQSNYKNSSKKLRKILSNYSSAKTFKNFSDIGDTKSSMISKNGKLDKNKSNSIVLKKNNFMNLFEQNLKKSTIIKNNKFKNSATDSLKILTLKEIGKNVKKTISEFDINKMKKELYDLENNEISEAIKNLPKKDKEEENKYNSKVSLYKSNFTNEEKIINNKNDEIKNGNLVNNINKHRKLFSIKKVYDSLDDEEQDDEEKINTFYLKPNSYIVYLIDSLILISSYIELFYLPFFLAYNIHKCKNEFLSLNSILFYLFDLIYILDVLAGFFRAFYDFEDLLVTDKKSIFHHYLTGWFLIDFFEAIPFYTIFNIAKRKCDINLEFIFLNNSSVFSFHYSLLLLKIFKIFKIFPCNIIYNKFVNILYKNNFFYNWSGFFSTLLVAISSLHFAACYFIFLGKNIYPGWIVECNIQSNSFIYIYITSLYYLMTTLTTVGYGDISVSTTHERIYQIILLIGGTCAYSWIVTFISNYIKKNNERYIDFEKKVQILGDIKINYPLLKNDLYERILRYLNYNKSENRYNVQSILDSLPLSLQNNLIVEMYKPIIKNFYFFKSFENSDFFVKIVTSLKPILSMKDDILVQEGDVIEDIIFVKNGVLSLEILIDLDSPKESAEAHLNMTGIGSLNFLDQTIRTGKGSKCNISQSIISQNSNMDYVKINSKKINFAGKTNTKVDTINDNKISSKKEIRIIYLRKNEHYGDVLMILNERSPLTVKVKSKKAELFFLQKTDATEISNQYPNIWKRIVNKSLYNMNQLKSMIRKKIIIFCDLNGININPELKKKYLDISEQNDLISLHNGDNKNKKKKKGSQSPKRKIETIIYEEDENFDSMCNTHTLTDMNVKKEKKVSFNSKCYSSKHFKSQRNSSDFHFSNLSLNIHKKNNKEFLSNNIINDNKKRSVDVSIFRENKNKKKKVKEKEKEKRKDKKIINSEDNQTKKSSSKSNSLSNINNMISIIDEKMKSSKRSINNLNINIFTSKSVKIPINQINNYKKTSESNIVNKIYEEDKNNDKINEEIYFNEDFNINLLKNDVHIDNSDINNKILYPNLKRKLTNKKSKNSLNLIKLLDEDKKSEIKSNNEDNISNKEINNKINKLHTFSNLNNSKEISFSIYSMYENLNKLSQYKFQRDSLLRQKTKNFIIDQCFSKQKSLDTTSLNFHKKGKEINFSPPLKIENRSKFKKINSPITNVDESEIKFREKFKKKRFCSIDNGNLISKFNTKESKEKTYEPIRAKKRISSIIFRNKLNKTSSINQSILSQGETSHKKKMFKRTVIGHSIKVNDDDKEMSFYSRVQTFRKAGKIKDNEKDKDKDPSQISRKKINLKEQISQNIEKNKQNLNNPEEYFSGFFNDILLKKKTIRNTKIIKDQKNYNQTLFYKNKKEFNNSKSLSKQRYTIDFTGLSQIKRNSTTNDEIIKQIGNNKLDI